MSKDRLAAIKFFGEEIKYTMMQTRKNAPTKKLVLENLDSWINIIETIIGITEE
jgi:hypothetical protein